MATLEPALGEQTNKLTPTKRVVGIVLLFINLSWPIVQPQDSRYGHIVQPFPVVHWILIVSGSIFPLTWIMNLNN